MQIKKLGFLLLVALILTSLNACGGDDQKSSNETKSTMTEQVEKKAEAKTTETANVDPMKNTGIGPVKELTLPSSIDQALAASGKKIFKEKCTACHKVSKRFIGPSPKGIFERRNPAWVMNMILNPDEMIKKDPIAKKLLMEANGSPMANQGLTEEDARSVVEYFRTL